MRSLDLVELAAIIAQQAPVYFLQKQPLSANAVYRFWMASRCRTDRWTQAIKRYGQQADAASTRQESQQRWGMIRPLLEEILISEVLTRVWAAVATAHDQIHGHGEVEPVVRSVLNGHLESRNRTLNLMVYGQGFDARESVELNRIRRRAERWNDLLLGYVISHHDVAEFAFDPQRATDFASDVSAPLPQLADPGWQLTLASMRASFERDRVATSPNGDLNREIAAAILAAVPANSFDGTGLPRSLWTEWLSSVTSDTQMLVEEALSLDDLSSVSDWSFRGDNFRRLEF